MLDAAGLDYNSFFAAHCKNIEVLEIAGEQVGETSCYRCCHDERFISHRPFLDSQVEEPGVDGEAHGDGQGTSQSSLFAAFSQGNKFRSDTLLRLPFPGSSGIIVEVGGRGGEF